MSGSRVREEVDELDKTTGRAHLLLVLALVLDLSSIEDRRGISPPAHAGGFGGGDVR